MNNNKNGLEYVLDGLMSRYKKRVPDVSKIIDTMQVEGIISREDDIENDHIAFRTLGVPNLGIESLEKIFINYGFQKRDYYFFPEKKLDAFWYSPPMPSYPRVFISELRVDDLNSKAQTIIKSYTSKINSDPVEKFNLDNPDEVDYFLHSSLWATPTIGDYRALSLDNEYAAWAIFNNYYLNHFTISVHNLKEGYNTIPDFNAFLERNDFLLNDSGSKIKKSADGLLLQSSTVAQMIEAEFGGEKKMMIPGSYIEFAERKLLPQFALLNPAELKREHRREGFEAANADKIFESTYSSQTVKR